MRFVPLAEAGQFQCAGCGEVFAQWYTQNLPIYTSLEARSKLGAAKPFTRTHIGKPNLAAIFDEILDPAPECSDFVERSWRPQFRPT